jgi:hypothetical protein
MLAINAASPGSGAGRHRCIEEPSEEVVVTISTGAVPSLHHTTVQREGKGGETAKIEAPHGKRHMGARVRVNVSREVDGACHTTAPRIRTLVPGRRTPHAPPPPFEPPPWPLVPPL